MTPYAFHPAALHELDDTAEGYELTRRGLGNKFLASFERSVGMLETFPELYAPDEATGARHCPLRKYPYTIVYLFENDCIRITAVMHQSREPGYWHDRLADPRTP